MVATRKQPRRVRRASRGREDILTAACEIVAERGYENTRFSDVAERSGASISTLQYLFGSREDLIVQALMTRTHEYLTEAKERAEAEPDPIIRLRCVALHLSAGGGSEAETRLGWLVWTEYWRAALRDDELASDSVSMYRGWRELLREAIRYAVSKGVIREPADIDTVVDGACAIADGLGIQMTLRESKMTHDRANAITQAWLANALSCPQIVTDAQRA